MRMLRERKSQFVGVTQPSPSPAQCQSRAVFFTLNINEGKHLPSSPSLSSVLVQCGIKYHISCLIIQKTIVNDIFCQIVGVLYSPDTLNTRYLAKIVLSRLAICHHQHSGQNCSLTPHPTPPHQSSIPLFFLLNLIFNSQGMKG